MPVQVWKVFQGTDTQIAILLSGGIFTGSESLSTTVSRGDNQPVLTTLATAWNEPTATRPSLIATITAAQSLALRPGAYQTLVLINGTVAGDVGVLNVFAGTGGTGEFRSLITVPEAVLLVPDFQTSQTRFDALAPALKAATVAIEGYVGRTLTLSTFDRLYKRPRGGFTTLYLAARPVVEVTTLECDEVPIDDYLLDADEGEITILQPWLLPAWSEEAGMIHAVYRAGYAVLDSDLAAGLDEVPDDLKLACAMMANAMLAQIEVAGPVISQSVGGRSYQLRTDASAIPHEVTAILDSYCESNRGAY